MSNRLIYKYLFPLIFLIQIVCHEWLKMWFGHSGIRIWTVKLMIVVFTSFGTICIFFGDKTKNIRKARWNYTQNYEISKCPKPTWSVDKSSLIFVIRKMKKKISFLFKRESSAYIIFIQDLKHWFIIIYDRKVKKIIFFYFNITKWPLSNLQWKIDHQFCVSFWFFFISVAHLSRIGFFFFLLSILSIRLN